MRKLLGFLFGLTPWKAHVRVPDDVPKAIIVMAPHTSNWDFVIGRLGLYQGGVRVNFMIKKEVFFFPLGFLLRALGGIPVDRAHSQKTVKSLTRMFEQADSFYLVITPEGTRKRVMRWKKGFYFMARAARVPLILGYLDYRKKEGGLGPVIYPSGDYEKDLAIIQDFYRDKGPRYPEKFYLPEKEEKSAGG